MSLSRPTMSAIRFGYGIRPGEALPDGADALLQQLDEAQKQTLRFPIGGVEQRYRELIELNDRVASLKNVDKRERKIKSRPIRRGINQVLALDQHARVAQSAFSPYGFHERLATFWCNHFSVSARKFRTMYLIVPLYEVEAIRPNMTGSFSQLLRAAIQHPAMLTYLDQIKSAGPNSRRGKRKGQGLNENLGRELLELHTLGVDGGYKQADVRDAAMILTGLGIEKNTGKGDFKPLLAEPGPLTFMGKSYGGRRRSIDDVNQMLDDIAAMPQTGRHICRKLAVHFISDKPPEALIEAMNDAWTKSGGNLRTVYAAMLGHPAAWENPGEKARQPYDFVVAGLRALGIPEQALAPPAADEEQQMDADTKPIRPAPAMASNPDGKTAEMAKDEDMRDDEAADREATKKSGKRNGMQPGLNPLTVGTLRKLGQPVWEPGSPAGFEEGFSMWISSSQITGRIEWAQRAAAKFGGRESPNDLLKVVLNDAARDDTIKVVSQAPNKTAGMALMLASPEFNRR